MIFLITNYFQYIYTFKILNNKKWLIISGVFVQNISINLNSNFVSVPT